jgi:hypothetical protein
MEKWGRGRDVNTQGTEVGTRGHEVFFVINMV